LPVRGGFCGSWVSSNVLHVISINREYAVMNYTEKEHNAQLEEADALETSIEILADAIHSKLTQNKFVLDIKGNQIHIDDFICDVEIDPYDMSRFICGEAEPLQIAMCEKLYAFSVKLATEIMKAKKS